jgi:YgiT-type zinc finger domain-containing protein
MVLSRKLGLVYNKASIKIMQDQSEFEKYKSLLEENAPEGCEACGGPLNIEKVNLEDYQGGKLYMMESIPAFVCQDCGETWVPEMLMHEFEDMISFAKEHDKAQKLKLKKLNKGRK